MRSTKAPPENRLTYVFDLDGVIYRGDEPQPHARETILALRVIGHTVWFYTNNSSQSRQSYADKLSRMGIPTSIDEIMTSSYATALYLVETGAAGGTVFQIGEWGITEELEAVGMKIITNGDQPDARIDFVVVGIDREFSYRKLARAQKAIFDGAKFIATNEDATFPIEGGGILPGGGCMVAAIRTATSVKPFLVGKPETYAYKKILELTDTPPERSVMVGDRLETDIELGNRAGARTVLVLTGVATREEAEEAMGYLKPERIIETLAELAE